jgi:hypothetical protein
MDDPEPGGEEQIDYGDLGAWVDPQSGRKRRVWAFVMVLPRSRHMFVRPVQRAWTECHVVAFEFFDGVPVRLVPDNLKTGWTSQISTIRRSTGRMPNSPSITARWSTRRGREAEGQAAGGTPDALCWNSFWRPGIRVLATHAGTSRPLVPGGGRSSAVPPPRRRGPDIGVRGVEAGELKPLPRKRFVLATWSTGTIGPDIHVRVGKSLYSVPWRHIGRRVDARDPDGGADFRCR